MDGAIDWSKTYTDAHECSSTIAPACACIGKPAIDQAMDFHNQQVGREIIRTHLDPLGNPLSQDFYVQLIKSQLLGGQAKWFSPLKPNVKYIFK
jgi:hypothetical protein